MIKYSMPPPINQARMLCRGLGSNLICLCNLWPCMDPLQVEKKGEEKEELREKEEQELRDKEKEMWEEEELR